MEKSPFIHQQIHQAIALLKASGDMEDDNIILETNDWTGTAGIDGDGFIIICVEPKNSSREITDEDLGYFCDGIFTYDLNDKVENLHLHEMMVGNFSVDMLFWFTL